jgi:hypothetical protein
MKTFVRNIIALIKSGDSSIIDPHRLIEVAEYLADQKGSLGEKHGDFRVLAAALRQRTDMQGEVRRLDRPSTHPPPEHPPHAILAPARARRRRSPSCSSAPTSSARCASGNTRTSTS